MKLRVLVHPVSSNRFVADVPLLPGCSSQGRTMDEALVNLKAAANTWLDEAFAELDVEVSDAEDEAAMQQALALMPTPEKLKHLLKTKPAPASWFAEEFQRPTSV